MPKEESVHRKDDRDTRNRPIFHDDTGFLAPVDQRRRGFSGHICVGVFLARCSALGYDEGEVWCRRLHVYFVRYGDICVRFTGKMRLEAMLKCVKARIDQMIGGKK